MSTGSASGPASESDPRWDPTGPPRCDGCGRPVAEGDHARCRERRAATDPPRFCTTCGRKLVVQVLPVGWTARCVACDPPPR